MASRSGFLLLVLAVVGLLSGPLAHGQIVHEKPGKIKAANRRALRESKKTDSPYKDSHLDVTREQLKRGQSTPSRPEGSEDLRYKNGTAPNVKKGLLGLRRDKTSTLVRKEQRQKPKSAEKGAEKK
ncbi:hypothetical protein [Hymenobacter rubidus]|uniref:hypothetical protein n=1 Tax=Hymenobacter rubidus TaxID=1441626 RepID=UPI00191F0CCD|nr:hypothetical protein [Hymenobacter rubidus]